MNVKLFSACAAALILIPLLSQQAQANGETLHELQPESTEIVRELLVPNSTQFTTHETSSSHSIIVRCNQLAQYERENIYEFEDFIEEVEGQSTDWEYHHHHEPQNRSTIREILRNRSRTSSGNHSLTIEIQGQCDDFQLQVEPPSSRSYPPLPLLYPNQGQSHSIEQYLEWYEDQMIEENIPWIIRPGSGWHWLLREPPVEGLRHRQDTP